MKTHLPHNRALIISKIALGLIGAAVLAGTDHNGLSLRDILVGGGTVIATTITLVTTIEQGVEHYVAGHVSIGLLWVDCVTGIWLNVNPYLDNLR